MKVNKKKSLKRIKKSLKKHKARNKNSLMEIRSKNKNKKEMNNRKVKKMLLVSKSFLS